ncbi:PIG-L deacetylase family protein [Thioalkalicoccus limnaeus]|uniref:PIG-L deacetylase family protein n=1 Tax=Thioalkalicoccus limnaeus TaxID=120681 RepID=A0ABV4BC40_9GAMM
MRKVPLFSGEGPTQLLCIGAHSDDIEIGCGGTIIRILEEYKELRVVWVVLSANEERRAEAEVSAGRFLQRAKETRILVAGFRDGYFPYIGAEIKAYFDWLKGEVSPDLIFTHFRSDLHQDHRIASELTWNSFRDHLIFEYEIPKYDGGLSSPNVLVELKAEYCREKVRHLLDCFPSQRGKAWFSEETFLAIMRLRGMEANASSNYAEGFYSRKLVV